MANIKNLANGVVFTAPSPATSGTSIVLDSGQGARMPTVPFYLTCSPQGELSTVDNSEIVLVTARSTDTLTVTRAQLGTSAKSIAVGWVVANGVYAHDVSSSRVVMETPSGSVNGSNALFTCANGYLSGTLEIFINGLRQSSSHFTATSPSAGTFTLSDAPLTGDNIDVNYQKYIA